MPNFFIVYTKCKVGFISHLVRSNRCKPLLQLITTLRVDVTIKLDKRTIVSDSTHCAWAHHDMSIRPIQVGVTLYLGQTSSGS